MFLASPVGTGEMLVRPCMHHGFDLQAHKAFEDNFWATKMNLTVRARA